MGEQYRKDFKNLHRSFMKIAMLIDWWEPIFWWWQVHVKELCRWLIENHNCEIDLFVRKLKEKKWKKYNKDETLLQDKLNVFRIWPTTAFFNIFWRFFSLINTILFLLYKAKKEKYTVIHAHAYVSWIPAKIVWRILKIPVIYTIHWANNLDINKKWFFTKIEKWLLTWIKYDLEISVWKDFLKYTNINDNIKIIPNWVDINQFDSVSINKKYTGINFLWVWRFSWEKWLKYLVSWISLIDKQILKEKWFKLNLVGSWEEELKIKQLVWKLKLEEFIIFKWAIFWQELIKEYKKNSIFILPSLSEWQPLTLLEWFASKLPIIATDVWDNNIFINDMNWFLIHAWNDISIKNVIETVLNHDKSDLLLLWDHWYEWVVKNYTWDIMVKKIFNCYKEIQ